MIEADEEFFEDLELMQASENTEKDKKRKNKDAEQGCSKIQKD